MTGCTRSRAAGLDTPPREHVPETPIIPILISLRLTSGRLKFGRLLYYPERECHLQVLAASSGYKLLPLDDTLATRVAEQIMGERQQSELFFVILRRRLA